MPKFVVAIDQGTTSTRSILFDKRGNSIESDQKEHEQIYPKPGWVEHDPLEIWQRTQEVVSNTIQKAGITADEVSAIGITNQRETTIVWDKNSGQPIHNAVVWQDTRTDRIIQELGRDGGQNRFQASTGLPLSTYFSGPKIRWILDHVDGAQERAEAGDLYFGNIDTWLIWNLTGGVDGGIHVTDVTNAGRTMLMNLETLKWDDEILQTLNIPKAMLPEIRSSSQVYGEDRIILKGTPVAGDLGDQHAALFGQTCFTPGEAKNTYGTGCFMLINTGNQIYESKNGLLTTVGYQIGDQDAVYALEGSIAITGALVQWLRDNLGIIESSSEVEDLARSVDDHGGIYFVPAFSGLFAPYWRSDARGAIVGMTRYINKGHIARAALEATAFQTKEVLDAMEEDSGVNLQSLKVDGGMVFNELLMQFQADILGKSVVRPQITETTALGAAYAAGLAVGFWRDQNELLENWKVDKTWNPDMDPEIRKNRYAEWKKAVTRTFDWVS